MKSLTVRKGLDTLTVKMTKVVTQLVPSQLSRVSKDCDSVASICMALVHRECDIVSKLYHVSLSVS